MATGPTTKVADLVVPTVFTPYVQQMTERKSRIVQSGILERSPFLDTALAGGGTTFNVPSFRDLDDDADNIGTDDTGDLIAATVASAFPGTALDSSPFKIETDTEIAVRLNRNASWSSARLAGQLAGADPLGAIQDRVANYWEYRLQTAFVATMSGVFKDNAANDSGDYTNDVSGVFADGVTNFTAEGFLDAKSTMGDSMNDLVGMIVHSTVMTRMQKLNLIDFIPDARGETMISTYQGMEVVMCDAITFSGNDYDTWLFGRGAVQLGVGTPDMPTEIERHAAAGNGQGQDVLFSRQMWAIHPTGHAFTGSPGNGGPTNAASTNNLDDAGSWNRVYPERAQVKIARYITTEA